MSAFICGCCQELFPTIHRHTHHIVPRASGGSDAKSNLIDLCPGCHDTLHNVAIKMTSKKTSRAAVIDSVRLIYKDNHDAVRRCIELAQHVRDAFLTQQERGVPTTAPVGLGTTLTKGTKDLVVIRHKSLGLSQEAYLRHLVIQDLCGAFPQHRDTLVREDQAVKQSKRRRKSGNL